MTALLVLALLTAAPAKADAGAACWTRAQRIDHGRVWPCLKSPTPRADGQNEAICAPTEAEVLAQAASVGARPCESVAPAKPATAAPCWSWRTLTYVTPKARYVCLRAPEGEYVHDNGKVVIEFCDTTEGPVLGKAAEHHLAVCAQVRDPGKAVTPGAPDCWQATTISENGKTYPCLQTYGPGIQINGQPARQFCADSSASLAAEVGKYNLPRCVEPYRPPARVTPPGPVSPTPAPPSVRRS